MKIASIALAVSLLGTASFADGLSWGGEANAEYNVDAENMAVTVTPEISYGMGQATLLASTDLAVYNDEFVIADTLEVLPVVDFRAEYALRDNVELYGEVSYDLDAKERGDLVIGATFSF
jgi:hypothetical protein